MIPLDYGRAQALALVASLFSQGFRLRALTSPPRSPIHPSTFSSTSNILRLTSSILAIPSALQPRTDGADPSRPASPSTLGTAGPATSLIPTPVKRKPSLRIDGRVGSSSTTSTPPSGTSQTARVQTDRPILYPRAWVAQALLVAMISGLAAYWVGGLGIGLGRLRGGEDDGVIGHAGAGGVAGMLMGWDLRRILFWVLVVMMLCVVAILSTPTETSFKSYLTELSFRRHLRDLHHPLPPNPSTRTPTPSSEESGPPSTSVTDGFSPTSTTPFRFSNHVAITLRTPGYHFRNMMFFSLVVIFPRGKGRDLGSSKGSSSSSVGKGLPARLLPSSTGPSNTHSTDLSHTNGTSHPQLPSELAHLSGFEDPTVSGVWYLGAFGRWFSMGKVLPRQLAVMQDHALMGLSAGLVLGGSGAEGKKEVGGPGTNLKGKKEKDARVRAGAVGGEEGLLIGGGVGVGKWAGLLNVVALPDAKEDSMLDNVTKLSEDVEQARSTLKLLTPPEKSEASPPLGPNATLPLHTRSPNHKSLLSLPVSTPPPHPEAKATSDSHASLTKTKESPSPVIEQLQNSLGANQAQIVELRDQLGVYNSSVSNSHAQLHLVVEDLRRKKKEEDTERADLKHRMKHLEENKRQAESQRREAEKKLRAAEGARDEIQGHIDAMQEEVERMREEVEECGNVARGLRDRRDTHDKDTRESVEGKMLELQGLDLEVAQQTDLNAELSAKVVEAVELLQSLIEHSPQPGEQAHQAEGYSYGTTPYNPSGRNSPEHLGTGHHVPEPRTFGNAYPSFEPGLHTRQAFSGSNLQQDQHRPNLFYPAPLRQSSGPELILGPEYFGGTGDQQHHSAAEHFRGFDGSLRPLPQAAYNGFGEMLEPTSPSVSLSASFTASLLPQGLFRSLEGDMTPIDSQAGSDEDPIESLIFHDASPHPAGQLELDQGVEPKAEEEGWKTHTPKTTSPLLRSAAPSSSNGSSDPKHVDNAFNGHANSDSLHDAVSRKLLETSGHVAPRKWFSSSRLRSADTVTAEESGVRTSNDSLRGEPLVPTTSNESLTLSGTGYSNPFAPSAAEKKALRWGTLNKWGGLRQAEDFPPIHLRSATGTYLGGASSGRSSSADLTARSAWDHAAVGDATTDRFTSPSGVDELSSSEEKRHFKFFSMGRKSAKESSPGNGIWKS